MGKKGQGITSSTLFNLINIRTGKVLAALLFSVLTPPLYSAVSRASFSYLSVSMFSVRVAWVVSNSCFADRRSSTSCSRLSHSVRRSANLAPTESYDSPVSCANLNTSRAAAINSSRGASAGDISRHISAHILPGLQEVAARQFDEGLQTALTKTSVAAVR